MHTSLLFKSKITLFYISALILAIPTILSASGPAAPAAAGAGEFTQTAVGSKRHGAQPKDGPAAKKQKAEDVNKKAQEETFEEFEARVGMKNAEAFMCNAVKARTPEQAQFFATEQNVLHLYRNQALELACRSARHTPELVQWYIDHGAHVDGCGQPEDIPLWNYLVSSPASNTPGHPKVKILLQEGALLRPYGNNILQAMRLHTKKTQRDEPASWQEIRLLLKQYFDYRYAPICQALTHWTDAQGTSFPRELQTLVAQYYPQEPTYEELDKESQRN